MCMTPELCKYSILSTITSIDILSNLTSGVQIFFLRIVARFPSISPPASPLLSHPFGLETPREIERCTGVLILRAAAHHREKYVSRGVMHVQEVHHFERMLCLGHFRIVLCRRDHRLLSEHNASCTTTDNLYRITTLSTVEFD